MKAIYLFLIIGMFCISFASAWEWDNWKTYDEKTRTVTIRNGILGTVIATIKLNTPLNLHVVDEGEGVLQRVAEFDIDNKGVYTTAFKKMEFYISSNMAGIKGRDFTYKFRVETGVREVPYYNLSCTTKNVMNLTTQSLSPVKNCSQVLKSTRQVKIYEWKEFDNINSLAKGNITVAVFADVWVGDDVEWIPTFFGVRIDEWARWTEALNVDLKSYYKFNEVSGDVVDSVGIDNGTNTGSERGQAGKINESFYFNGSSDYVTLGNTLFLDNMTDFSLVGWFKVDNPTIQGNWFGDDGTANGKIEWGNVNSHQYLRVGAVVESTGQDIPIGEWVHLGVTVNSTTTSFFMNGTLIERLSAGFTPFTDLTATYFGKRDTTTYLFNGSIDEVGIWNRTLTDGELTSIYNNGTGITWAPAEIVYTYNESTYETDIETISVNVADETNATLYYGGTPYAGTQVGENWNVTIELPLGITNNSFYWEFGGGTSNSSNFSQYVNPINLTNCYDGAIYLNFTFKDEDTDKYINASIPTSTFYYWMTDPNLNKSITYVNTSENETTRFCFTPADRTINTYYTMQYRAVGYPQRIYESPTINATNSTVDKVLYLLKTGDGLYVTLQVLNLAEQTVQGVDVTVNRTIGGTETTVANAITGADGSVTFWLNPNFMHKFNFIKEGYTTFLTSFIPSQSSYTIQMGGTESIVEDYTKGVTYSVQPIVWSLDNGTTYNFNFTLDSSYWDLDEFGFVMLDEDGNSLGSDSVLASNSGTADLNLGTGTYDNLIMNFYWVTNNTYSNGTRTWLVYDSSGNNFSLLRFFTDLSLYIDSGIFGFDTFAKGLLVFVICLLFVGGVGMKYGFNSISMMVVSVCALIGFLDVGVGIVPNPLGAIPHFPTIFLVILSIGILFKEGTR